MEEFTPEDLKAFLVSSEFVSLTVLNLSNLSVQWQKGGGCPTVGGGARCRGWETYEICRRNRRTRTA